MSDKKNKITVNHLVLDIISRAYADRQRYWPHYTWGIQTSWSNISTEKSDILASLRIQNLLNEKWSDIFSKINASFYHLERIKECEAYKKEIGRQIAKAPQQNDLPEDLLSIFGPTYEPVNYEYESLLVTTKSALDILTVVLSEVAGMKVDNFLVMKDQISNKKLKDVSEKIQILFGEDLAEVLDKEFRNKGKKRSKRNHAVHVGALPLATMNVRSTAKSSEVDILDTSVMSGMKMCESTRTESVSSFSERLFFNTTEFIIRALEIIFDEELKRGEKKSVLQFRIDKFNQEKK